MPYNSTASVFTPLINPPTDFRGLILRPRAADRDPATLGVTTPRAGKFPEMADAYIGLAHPPSGLPQPGQDGLPDDIDHSGFIGDCPAELDVDTDGDGLNDAIWVDLGHPVIQIGDSSVKPLFAFKVVGMDGRINLNAHGNLYKVPYPYNSGTSTTPSVAQTNFGPGLPNSSLLTPNYSVMHKSNLGASPTEINPLYGIILGDNPGPASYASTNVRPPLPTWGVYPPTAGMTVLPDPYQRLLEGFTNPYTGEQVAGRWTGTTQSLPGIAFSDDNGNLTLNPTNQAAQMSGGLALLENLSTATVTGTYTYYYDGASGYNPLTTPPTGTSGTALTNGGSPISTQVYNPTTGGFTVTPPLGSPAAHGSFSPVDLYGLGVKYSPLSYSAQLLGPTLSNNANLMGLIFNSSTTTLDGNLIHGFLNYARIDSNFANPNPYTGTTATPATYTTIGANSFTNGTVTPASQQTTAAVSLSPLGLPEELTLANEATETNLYNPVDDTLFTAMDIATLLRANDYDSSSNESRLSDLWPDQLEERTIDIAPADLGNSQTQTPTYYTAERFAQRRMQNLFTHESWDLIRYNCRRRFFTLRHHTTARVLDCLQAPSCRARAES